MRKFGTSQSGNRAEDTRFLTGQACYADDIAPIAALQDAQAAPGVGRIGMPFTPVRVLESLLTASRGADGVS
ncbi:MAG: hypothetical protein ACRCSU_12030 [Paracoccaceae bacterium]